MTDDPYKQSDDFADPFKNADASMWKEAEHDAARIARDAGRSEHAQAAPNAEHMPPPMAAPSSTDAPQASSAPDAPASEKARKRNRSWIIPLVIFIVIILFNVIRGE